MRVTTIEQPTEIVPHDPIPAAQLERQLDRGALVAQEADARLTDVQARAVQVVHGETGLTVPTQASRLNKLLGFDAGGSLYAYAVTATSLELLADVSAEIDIVAGIKPQLLAVYANITGINTVGTVAAIAGEITTLADIAVPLVGLYDIRDKITALDALGGTMAALYAIRVALVAVDANQPAINAVYNDINLGGAASFILRAPAAAETATAQANIATAAATSLANAVDLVASLPVRRLSRLADVAIVDRQGILDREPGMVTGPWTGATIYGMIATGDSTSVGVSGGAPATPVSAKSLMFNGGILPSTRTALVPAQEQVVETGMTSIGEAFYTLAGPGAPPLFLACAGQSGSSIGSHLPGATYNVRFVDIITAFRDLVAAAGGRAVIPFVFFSEGTNDESYSTAVGNPLASAEYMISDYADKLIIFAEGIQRQVKRIMGQDRAPKIALIQNANWTYVGAQTGSPVRSVVGRIGLGHRLAFFQRPDLFTLVGPQYQITHEGPNTGLHPAGAGYIRRASDVARTLYAEMYGRDSRPLHQIGIEHTVGTDFAVINYYSPSGAIVADTVTVTDPNGAWGFEVADTNTVTPLTIAGVPKIAGTSVLLRFNRVTVSYPDFGYALTGVANAGSGPLGARGCIRDTSVPPAWAIYSSTKVLP
ncbi:hypothetical protein [Sphingomonas alpina]|uniref:hypothetical protein n=1 Tax=Sphingomonas alpina TaxID=653931 RepID=UPI0021BAD2BA|nr:hypothetical protein [Sphingomonas alpina]